MMFGTQEEVLTLNAYRVVLLEYQKDMSNTCSQGLLYIQQADEWWNYIEILLLLMRIRKIVIARRVNFIFI